MVSYCFFNSLILCRFSLVTKLTPSEIFIQVLQDSTGANLISTPCHFDISVWNRIYVKLCDLTLEVYIYWHCQHTEHICGYLHRVAHKFARKHVTRSSRENGLLFKTFNLYSYDLNKIFYYNESRNELRKWRSEIIFNKCCQATLLSRAQPDISCTAGEQAPARFARRILYFALVGSLRKPNFFPPSPASVRRLSFLTWSFYPVRRWRLKAFIACVNVC